MSRSDHRPVALFDLDGVLTRRDTFATLVRRRLTRSPVRLALALPALPVMAATSAVPRARGPVARYLVRVALLGAEPDAVRTDAERLAGEFAQTPAWLDLAGIRAALEHLDRGDRVVVVTATEETLARSLLDRLGLGAAEVVASQVAAGRFGARLHPHNYGRRKLAALCGRLPEPPWPVMYTDSWADAPLLRNVEHSVLVRPSRRLRRRAARGLVHAPSTLGPVRTRID